MLPRLVALGVAPTVLVTMDQLPVFVLTATPTRPIVPVTNGSILVGAAIELDRPTNARLPVCSELVPNRIVKKNPPLLAALPRHTCSTLCRCEATVPAVVPVLNVARRTDVSKLVEAGVGFATVPVLVNVVPKPPTVVPPAGIIIDTRLNPRLACIGVSTPAGPIHLGITLPAISLA